MNISNVSSARSITRVIVIASTFAVLGVGLAGACHPQGVITKGVQNLTTGSAMSTANTSATAVTAHTGDILRYTVAVSNIATANRDELINTTITDSLPAGLSLVKADSFTIGTVSMKQTISRTITVKVNQTTAGDIKNTACFTGDSVDHKVPQKGCDIAYVKVVVSPQAPSPQPKPVVTPAPKPTPLATPAPTTGMGQALGAATVAPATLPVTGADNASAVIGLTAMISTGAAYLKSRKR
jgi:uncharacterized repeat protein (TIGR01451 family)